MAEKSGNEPSLSMISKMSWRPNYPLTAAYYDAHIAEAKYFLKAGQYDDAEILCARLIEHWGRRPQPRILFARAAMLKGEWESALLRWTDVIDRFPGTVQAYLGRAHALMESERWSDAQKTFLEIIERWPSNVQGAIGYVRVALRMGDRNEALKRWQETAEKFPANPKVLGGYLDFLIKIGRLKEAENICQRIERNDGPTLGTIIGFAKINARQRQWAEAAKLWQSAIAKNPSHLGALAGCVDALLNTGQFEQAEELNRRFLDIRPDAPKGRFLRARILHANARNKEALELAEKNLRNFSDRKEAYVGLAAILLDEKEYSRAVKIVEAGLERWPNEVKFLNMLSRISIATESWQDAKNKVERIIELEPGNEAAKLSLGRVLSELGFLDEAEVVLRGVIESDENRWGGYVALSNVLERMRRLRKGSE